MNAVADAAKTDEGVERRDFPARAARDQLATILDIPADQLRHISRHTAESVISTIATSAQAGASDETSRASRDRG